MFSETPQAPASRLFFAVVLPLALVFAASASAQSPTNQPSANQPAPVTIAPTIVPDPTAAPPTPVAVPSLAGTPAQSTQTPATTPNNPPAKVPPVVAVPSLAGTPADTTPSAAPGAPAQAAVPPAAPPPATFGFVSGESRDQIIAAIGAASVVKSDGDILEVNTSPTRNATFDSFLLIVGPRQGLVKIIATGVDIEGDSEGKQMKAAFAQLRSSLKTTFGDPSDNFDYLKADSTHKKSSEFMLSLTNNERTLAAYWTKPDLGSNITSVALEGNGLGTDKGYISIEVEFAPYRDYVLTRKP